MFFAMHLEEVANSVFAVDNLNGHKGPFSTAVCRWSFARQFSATSPYGLWGTGHRAVKTTRLAKLKGAQRKDTLLAASTVVNYALQ